MFRETSLNAHSLFVSLVTPCVCLCLCDYLFSLSGLVNTSLVLLPVFICFILLSPQSCLHVCLCPLPLSSSRVLSGSRRVHYILCYFDSPLSRVGHAQLCFLCLVCQILFSCAVAGVSTLLESPPMYILPASPSLLCCIFPHGV